MNFMSLLSSFYGESFENRFILLVIFWLIWPGLMFLVGFILESRLVPIGDSQSKMFFPGDLSLGVMLVAIIGMYTKTGVDDVPLIHEPHWWLALVIIVGLSALWLRNNEAPNYPGFAFRSPTKITHDIMGYFIIPFVLLGFGIPQLIMLKFGVFEAVRMNWFALALAIVFFLFCGAMDLLTFYDRKDIATRHPDDWQPIWRKKRHR